MKFERLRVNLLCYIEKRNGTAVLLREIENFERSEFEPSRVTCNLNFLKYFTVLASVFEGFVFFITVLNSVIMQSVPEIILTDPDKNQVL